MKQQLPQKPQIPLQNQNHEEIAQTTTKINNDFSFLIDTQNYETDQNSKILKNEKQNIDNFLTQLKQINQTLTERMNRMNQQISLQIGKQEDKKIKQKIKSQLFHKGKQHCNSKGLIGISSKNQDIFIIKKNLKENNKPLQVPSNFQIDQNQNFIKINLKAIAKQNFNYKIPIISLSTLALQKIGKPSVSNMSKIEQSNSKKTERRRIYESVLSKFSTASLIAMNKDE